MEQIPMTLGSPSHSPAGYLPPFLMGETIVPTTPRSNTLSPAKGRALAFAQSPGTISNSPDFNNSNYQQKPFLGFAQSPPQHSFTSPTTNINKSISGPPTQGLFDSLRAEKNVLHAPTNRGFNQNQSMQQMGTSTMNQSYQYNQSFNNDSFLNQSGFNPSRIASPVSNMGENIRTNSVFNTSNCMSPHQYTDFWITVYGFPVTSLSIILSHFSQCGSIIDKVCSSQNGNWIHLKYSSRLECDRALNYNEKILGNNLMIGVTRCKDPVLIDKENVEAHEPVVNRVRPLVHMGYKIAQHPTDVVPTIAAPKKSTGIVNKAMDLFFGW